MFSRHEKGDCSGGMAHVIKIRRKPKGIGCEAKTVADEGKEAYGSKTVACRERSNNFNNIQADKALSWKCPDCPKGFVVCLSEDCGPASQAWPLLSWSSEACPQEVPCWSSQDTLSSWTWWPFNCNIDWQGKPAGRRSTTSLVAHAPLLEHAAPPFRVKQLENDASMMTAVCSTKLWNEQSSWMSIWWSTCIRHSHPWIHNHLRQDVLSSGVCPAGKPTSGIIEFMSLCWESSKPVPTPTMLTTIFQARYMQETSHVDFTRVLALKLIHLRDHDGKQRQRRAHPRWKLHRSKSRRSADGSTDSDGSEGIAKEHQLASLSSLTGKAHLQRSCVQCKPTFCKASYYCKSLWLRVCSLWPLQVASAISIMFKAAGSRLTYTSTSHLSLNINNLLDHCW